MTSIRVEPEAVAGLGDSLLALARSFEKAPGLGADRWAFGPAQASAEGFDEAVGSWRRERTILITALTGLGRAARTAGGAYVRTEAQAAGRFLTGGQQE